ncbi:MAG: glycosyltransferase [Saprospiraceae bacterium]|nr:glycosyltransferase [Candidatus Vicinibacter affinis]MBP6173173.1 glycosyltransferase [Saprospiraceae bacterium]MBK7799276.1 glycosyltransferase [Candidatus Vicinibacter affinis]MBK8642773.1 glycosyltransferase [Candidatus Vicinibacter affinis]MBP6521554.1 glycosyltransferase [Saprospiraceae bacterium]
MKLSVIIVNYNVRHFLEHALSSVMVALQRVSGEVIVVDNSSVDDSCTMVKTLFPTVKLIESPVNLGFSKANNLALAKAQGEYILFLNPDTVVSEDCLFKCCQFMDEHSDAGALGVKMLDGSGKILPESKRGFPTTWVSFCKLTGLNKLFPKSGLFNGYYMGQLDYESDHQIDILSGAFFFTRQSIMNKIGGFDEAFFMYGEDIDLSHRIKLAGYQNYYLANTSIIHYKGESTKKSNLNYYHSFYQAMMIFSKKYFKPGNVFGFLFFIKCGILLKGILSWIRNLIVSLSMPIFDALVMLSGIFLIKKGWSFLYFKNTYYFSSLAFWTNAALFTGMWLISFFLSGVYEKRFKSKDLLLSVIVGFGLNLVVYSLLPETLRSSRMILLFSFAFVLFYAMLSRIILNKLSLNFWSIGSHLKKNMVVVGESAEIDQVEDILKASKVEYSIVNKLNAQQMNPDHGYWNRLLKELKVNELIFCPSVSSSKNIMNIMSGLPEQIEVKMLTESGAGLIGSPSKNNPAELYTLDLQYPLNQKVTRRQKRVFDIFFSLGLLLFGWIFIFLQTNKHRFLLNVWACLRGSKSWVGYSTQIARELKIPIVKPGILTPTAVSQGAETLDLSNQIISYYALYYSVWMDLDVCLKNISKLDS